MKKLQYPFSDWLKKKTQNPWIKQKPACDFFKHFSRILSSVENISTQSHDNRTESKTDLGQIRVNTNLNFLCLKRKEKELIINI